MTEHESKLFNQLLEVNWELGQTTNSTIKQALMEQYWNLQEQISESMGRQEWKNFINTGREMFAPADQD